MLVAPRTYPYNASYVKMLLAGGLAAVGAWALSNEAMTNDRGLSIDGILNFDTNGATIFYWFLAGFAVLGCIIAVAAMLMRKFAPKEIKIDENEIIVPHGFMQSKTRRIGYNDITGLSETVVQRQTFLYLQTPSGKVALIAANLPSKDDYEDIKQFLVRKSEATKR